MRRLLAPDRRVRRRTRRCRILRQRLVAGTGVGPARRLAKLVGELECWCVCGIDPDGRSGRSARSPSPRRDDVQLPDAAAWHAFPLEDCVAWNAVRRIHRSTSSPRHTLWSRVWMSIRALAAPAPAPEPHEQDREPPLGNLVKSRKVRASSDYRGGPLRMCPSSTRCAAELCDLLAVQFPGGGSARIDSAYL